MATIQEFKLQIKNLLKTSDFQQALQLLKKP